MFRFDSGCRWWLDVINVSCSAFASWWSAVDKIRGNIKVSKRVTTSGSSARFSLVLSSTWAGWTCCKAEWGALDVAGNNNSPGSCLIGEDLCYLRAAKLGSCGTRPRMSRAIFDMEDNTPLPVSRRLCFIFLYPFIFLVNTFIWFFIFSSESCSPVRVPGLCALILEGVWRSSWMPIFVVFELLQSDCQSLTLNAVGFAFIMWELRASTSWRSSRFCFEHFFPCNILTSFSWTARFDTGNWKRRLLERRNRCSPSALLFSRLFVWVAVA